MELEFLKRLGFTDGEIKVYDALLKLGPTTTGRIIKEAGISSSKVYPILDRLIAKGMATHVVRANRRYYQPSSPRNILDLLRKREEEVKEQERVVKEMLPALLAREKQLKSRHEAVIYEGLKGVKAYFKGLLDSMKKGEERLVFGARSGYPIAKGAQYFFRNYHKKWIRKSLKTKIIFNQDLRKSKATGFYEGAKLTQVRYLPQVTLSSVGIQKDSVDILIWTKETVLVFVIKSKEVAKTFRGYFQVLWKSAKK